MTTGKDAVGEASAELAQEQAYVTMLYERLDAMRAGTARRLAEVRLGPTAENDQGWSEREMFAQEIISSLFPGVDAQGADSPEAARVKGDGALYRLTPRICRQARADAEQAADPDTGDPLPHNRARRTFIRAVIREPTRQRLRDHGDLRTLQPGEEEELRAELADAPAIHRVLDVLWPDVAPEQLLARLYAEPGRLDLADDQRAVTIRDTPGPWTPADVPPLDELAELLGAAEAAGRAARQRDAADEAERATQLEYADQLVSKLVSDGSIFVPRLEHDPFAAGRWRTARLTVNYRTDESPWHANAGAAAALGLSPGPDLDAPVAVFTPEQSKELGFDSVIIVDPAGIEQASPRGRADLYVALTRTTRRLGLVSHGELPGGLTAVLDQPAGQRIGGRL